MYNESRTDIYDFLYDLFYDVVTKNVYLMSEPQELTKSDTEDGFIVIRLGDIRDYSEFDMEGYAAVRCFVEAYIPTITRGRLDFDRYKEFEDSINTVIKEASEDTDSEYSVQYASILSMEDVADSNANSFFHMFIKSFLIQIDQPKVSNNE